MSQQDSTCLALGGRGNYSSPYRCLPSPCCYLPQEAEALLPEAEEAAQPQAQELAQELAQGSFQALSVLTDLSSPPLHLVEKRSLRAAPCALPELEQHWERGQQSEQGQAGVPALLSHRLPLASVQVETVLHLQRAQGQKQAAQALPCVLGESVHPWRGSPDPGQALLAPLGQGQRSGSEPQ